MYIFMRNVSYYAYFLFDSKKLSFGGLGHSFRYNKECFQLKKKMVRLIITTKIFLQAYVEKSTIVLSVINLYIVTTLLIVKSNLHFIK